MHILLKNLAIVTGFIVAITVLNAEVVLFNNSQNIIKYCKSEA